MKSQIKIVMNRTFNFFLLLGALLLLGAVLLITSRDYGYGFALGTLSLFLLIVPLFLLPYCYRFDTEGVSICYLFFSEERYLWADISSIYATEESDGNGSPILDYWFSGAFQLQGQVQGTPRFYMTGQIRKTRRTKQLLQQYWDGVITGCFGEEIKEYFVKRSLKKAKKTQQHLTDEVVPMEREIRAATREWIKPFMAEAKQLDLELRTDYLYITNKFEELHSRPQSGYTYTALMEISRPNETDENRILCISVDLLYVRLGKNAYRGVPNRRAEEQFCNALTETFKDLRKNAIESYHSKM